MDCGGSFRYLNYMDSYIFYNSPKVNKLTKVTILNTPIYVYDETFSTKWSSKFLCLLRHVFRSDGD